MLVGLGNPGRRYAHTRHNFGFMVVDKLSSIRKCELVPGKGDWLEASTAYSGKRVILAKPSTYMNRSGWALVDLIQEHDIPLSNLLVILDEINLAFGKLRFRKQGSDGGHQGLASIIHQLKSETFPRLRIGIGQEQIQDVVEFVLSEFGEQEQEQIGSVVEVAAKACLEFVEHGIEYVMNHYN